MKKNLLAMMSVTAAMLAFTGCSSEEPLQGSASGDGSVVLTVSLPDNGPASRAFSDGLSATDLTYAVYFSGTADLVKTEKVSAAFSTRQASLTLNLVKGKSYDVVFWADNAEAGYTFDPDTKSVTVSYNNAVTNAETRDAFFNHISFTVNGPSQQNVVLYRPFAQINLGTSDLADATGVNGYADFKSSLSVSTEMPTTLNLLTGETSGSEKVSFAAAAPPAGETFPVAGYDYVAMDYLLVGDGNQPTLIDCTFSFDDTSIADLVVNNVPVQRNYRTNIFGKLFTDATDIHILISPDYNTPDFNVPDWLADAAELPAEKNGEYEITTAAELAAVSKAVQEGNDFDGKVIKIMNDIDLLNRNWTPIGMPKNSSSNEGEAFKEQLFKGSIDGQNHTIRNLSISQGPQGLGLVGQMRGNGSYIRNLTIESAEVGNNYATPLRWGGALVGYINAEGDEGVTIENCHVKSVHMGNDFLGSNYAVGALAGYVSSCSAKFIDCSVESAVICNIASYNCAALLGKIYQGKHVEITRFKSTGVITYNGLDGMNPAEALAYTYGAGNGWLIGNIISYSGSALLDVVITDCSFGGASDWDNLDGANGASLLDAAEKVQPLFPYVGSFDGYDSNAGKITVDGTVKFENKQFK